MNIDCPVTPCSNSDIEIYNLSVDFLLIPGFNTEFSKFCTHFIVAIWIEIKFQQQWQNVSNWAEVLYFVNFLVSIRSNPEFTKFFRNDISFFKSTWKFYNSVKNVRLRRSSQRSRIFFTFHLLIYLSIFDELSFKCFFFTLTNILTTAKLLHQILLYYGFRPGVFKIFPEFYFTSLNEQNEISVAAMKFFVFWRESVRVQNNLLFFIHKFL